MVSAENFVMPSRVRPTISSTETPGLRYIVLAEALTRAQCRSRSGATPSNTLAPSNTHDPSQIACVRAPHNGTLPSCQPSSKYVQVFDQPCPGAIPQFLVIRGINSRIHATPASTSLPMSFVDWRNRGVWVNRSKMPDKYFDFPPAKPLDDPSSLATLG